MKPYRSKSGKKSGVSAFESGADYLIVWFSDTCYKYSYKSCGAVTTEKLKNLAKASEGLSTYIAQIDPKYEWKK